MLRLFRSRERAQIIVAAALLLPILLGMTGLAIDVGSYAAQRRELQNDADSIALAAGQSLPDSTKAQTAAAAWAAKNNISPSEYTLTISGGSVTPRARVVIHRNHNFAFVRIVGINSKDVGAVAAAGKFSFGSASGIVPWSITQETLNEIDPGDLVTIKYDSNGGNNGNFGAIRIDGNGASDYENSAKYGSTTRVCAVTTPGCTTSSCPGSYPSTCAETAPECDGPECAPKTGNMTGPTRDAVDFRKQYTSTSCDTFNEVFSPVTASIAGHGDAYAAAQIALIGRTLQRPAGPPAKQPTDTPTTAPTHTNTPLPTSTSTPVPTLTPAATNTAGPSPTTQPTNTPGATNTAGPSPTAAPASGRYAIDPNCNPWAGPGACPTGASTTVCSRRVIIIPVIDQFGNGSSDPVTIQRFALLFLEGYQGGKCTGSNCEIEARFVNANLSTGAIAGDFDASAPIQFAKLTE
ncbi:MAG TPA: pilus assembly protein TadG-related protein [Dehalococcoidia bacterium]|jgi:Flp pilus assembly protein TadG